MAKVRDILGHVRIEQAQRKRRCHRSRGKHSIAGGNSCLVIQSGAMMGSKNYCPECATPILERADGRLRELRAGLGIDGSGRARAATAGL